MKILVIGCGSIGQRHIGNLVSIKAGRIYAFDIDKQKLKETRKISQSVVTSQKLDKLWKEDIDATFITVPTALHVPYALEAAKRGCHLFIEKPLSHNMQGLNKLLKIVTSKKLITFVGYNYRFNTCVIKIKELLKNKTIGKLIAGRIHFGSYLPERHPWEDYRSGYGAKKLLGGGVILDALSHHLNSLIFVLGRPKKVFGYVSKRSNLDIDVEDTAEVLVKFSDNVVINLHTNFVQRPYKCIYELIGDSGTILCDLTKNILKYYDVSDKKWVTFYGERDPNKVYVKEIKHFIKCIKEKIPSLIDIRIAKKELEVLMKIKQSSYMQKWIKV